MMSHSKHKPPKKPANPDAPKDNPTGEIVPASVAFSNHNGEGLRQDNPRLYQAVVNMLREGCGIRLAAKLSGCSTNTVLAIGQANGLSSKEMKSETAKILRAFVRLGAERLLENVDTLPLSQLAVAIGIANDKAGNLDGQPSAIIEHRAAKMDRAEAEKRLRAALDISAEIVENAPVVVLPKPQTAGNGAAPSQNSRQDRASSSPQG